MRRPLFALSQLLRWLWELTQMPGVRQGTVRFVIGLGLAFLPADWIGYWLRWSRPDRLQLAGLILELLGLLNVVLGVWRLQVEMRPHPKPDTFRGWLQRFPLRKHNVVAGVIGVQLSPLAG